jgi:hypothetical protein
MIRFPDNQTGLLNDFSNPPLVLSKGAEHPNMQQASAEFQRPDPDSQA